MIKKKVFTGVLVGLIANCIGLFLTATFLGNGDDFTTVIKAAIREDFIGKLVSLGAILNLIVFLIFMRKRQDYQARGVLLVTVIIAISTFLIKFF